MTYLISEEIAMFAKISETIDKLHKKQEQLKNKDMKYLVWNKESHVYYKALGEGPTDFKSEAHHWTEEEIQKGTLRGKNFLEFIPVEEEKPKQFYIRHIDSGKYWRAPFNGVVDSIKEAHVYSESEANKELSAFSKSIELIPVDVEKLKKPNIYLVEVTVVGVIHLYVVGQSKQQVHDKVRESIGIMPIKISRISKYKGDATDFPFLTNTI